MTMASRDIANMHLFLEMKKKFPDLPEDMLRNYVFLYAEDQDKCIKLLQQESQNNFHPSQPFSDFRLSDSKTAPRKNESLRTVYDHQNNGSSQSNVTSVNRNLQKSNESSSLVTPSKPQATVSNRSTSHAGIVHYPHVSTLEVPLKIESHSAPVIVSQEKPFADMYKQIPASSHSTMCQSFSNQDSCNRMMFSTTKEHTIQPPVTSLDDSSTFLTSSPGTEQGKRHAVEFNLTPSFPFQQQQINLFNNAVCATASTSSRPGRHTTSLNFQLQPQTSVQYPIEISTIPANKGDPCNYSDFGSHVQISVGSQGATFTALRLQRPHPVQSQQAVYATKLSSEPTRHQFSESSSQSQDSKVYMFPKRMQPNSENVQKGMFMGSAEAQENFKAAYHQKYFCENFPANFKYSLNKSKSEDVFAHGYQLSPDYINAVKRHQKYLLKLIEDELEKEKNVCAQLKSEVNRMEQETTQRIKKNSFSYAEELKRLREENRKLRIECNCLLMEVDTSSPAQIPLGMTDEDFYSNIFTGPNGAISSSSSSKNVPNTITSTTKNSSYKEDAEDDDEKNRWRCKKCTFANYPALENCEMCELPRNSGSFFEDN